MSTLCSKNAALFWTSLLAISLQATASGQIEDSLADLSLEQLMNETVTSVSKKEQSLFSSPAAIAVLSNDDIRRSGATTLPDALRLVPGINVGASTASQNAVSARGFNNLYANKLLVLVDGRAVYSPLFAGVFWDLQQTSFDDLERIEVIRGPGATVWGSNAVNGVINVVTRSAKDTQGGLLYGGGGDVQETMVGARYGGRLSDNTYYRVYANEQSHDDYLTSSGVSAHDSWASRQGGFRVDHYPKEGTQMTWQTELTAVDFNDQQSDTYNFNTLGRWTRNWSDRSGVEVQAYYDQTQRNDTSAAGTTLGTLDFSLQHRFGIGERNDMIWGLGYRSIEGEAEQNNPVLIVRQKRFDQQIANVFLQDEIKLVPDILTASTGIKIEHNNFTGIEIQPSVSLVFTPTKQQTLWASASRAVRTPSIYEASTVFAALLGDPFVGPDDLTYVPAVVGNPDVTSEVLLAYELGWRFRPTDRVSVDLTGFYNDYKDIINYGGTPILVPGMPTGTAEIRMNNILYGHTYGGEALVTVSPNDNWRVTAAYSLLFASIHGPASLAETSENSSPKHQLSLRSAYDFSERWSLDGQLRYASSIEGVPSYLSTDLRLSHRPNEHLEFSLVGQNLFDPSHLEQPDAPFFSSSVVPRSFYGKITWRF